MKHVERPLFYGSVNLIEHFLNTAAERAKMEAADQVERRDEGTEESAVSGLAKGSVGTQ